MKHLRTSHFERNYAKGLSVRVGGNEAVPFARAKYALRINHPARGKFPVGPQKPMRLRDHVVACVQEVQFLRFGSGNPVLDIRHLSNSGFLDDHYEISSIGPFNVLPFIENAAQLFGVHPRYNVVWACDLMPDALQIRSRISDWLDGEISLSEFEDWFVPATWNIHKGNDPEAEELTDEIELSLSEYSGEYLSLDQLKDKLTELALVAHPVGSRHKD
jgi:hypothetical protein